MTQMDQQLKALSFANQVRSARAVWKARAKYGKFTATEGFAEPIAGGIRVGAALASFRGVGPKKVGYFCRRAYCEPHRRIETLDPMQIGLLCALVEEVGYKAREREEREVA